MRLTVMIGLVALATVSSAQAWAQDSDKAQAASTAPDAKKVAAKDPDEIICVRHTDPDSRIPSAAKECHTRRVWDGMNDTARQQTQDLQNRSGQLSTLRGG